MFFQSLFFVILIERFAKSHVSETHWYDAEGHQHTREDDHELFLGDKLKKEFDTLTLEESKRRLRLLIPHMDINKDGFVDMEELEIWIRHKMQRWISREDVGALFRGADDNFDDRVTWEEFTFRHYGFLEKDKGGIAEASKVQFADLIKRDKRRWQFADIDKDDLLDWKEFEFFRHPDEHEVMMRVVAMEELEEADTNKDGYLSLEEYIASIHLPEMRMLDEKHFYEKYDRNHDGKLDLDEVENWKRPDEFDKAKDEAKHLIEIADANKDGRLSSDEIMMSHTVFVGNIATQHGIVLHDEF